jgi:hypothetical protein
MLVEVPTTRKWSFWLCPYQTTTGNWEQTLNDQMSTDNRHQQAYLGHPCYSWECIWFAFVTYIQDLQGSRIPPPSPSWPSGLGSVYNLSDFHLLTWRTKGLDLVSFTCIATQQPFVACSLWAEHWAGHEGATHDAFILASQAVFILFSPHSHLQEGSRKSSFITVCITYFLHSTCLCIL